MNNADVWVKKLYLVISIIVLVSKEQTIAYNPLIAIVVYWIKTTKQKINELFYN